MTVEALAAERLLGKWVRVRANGPGRYETQGRPFKVHYLGHEQGDGRRCLYGPVECCWPEDVERLAPDEEEKAREEWERNVR